VIITLTPGSIEVAFFDCSIEKHLSYNVLYENGRFSTEGQYFAKKFAKMFAQNLAKSI
jgi:hypothetical protein